MDKLKLAFWRKFFYFGSFLEDLGERMVAKGLDELDNLTRENSALRKYVKNRIMNL